MKEEQLGWRDARISQRHRNFYGIDCPMTDIDLVAVAYDRAAPVALIEYKYARQTIHRFNNTSNVRALTRLADMAGLPAWVAYYRVHSWSYQIIPLNDKARVLFGNEPFISLCEDEYVEILYQVRGRKMPADVLACLNQSLNCLKHPDAVGPLTPPRWRRKDRSKPTKSVCRLRRQAR